MDLARIEIITGMSKFNGLKATLSKAGVRGMTVTQVLGCGIEKYGGFLQASLSEV